VLFNLDKAKAEMRKSDFAVLVEGQMDCISVYMAGIHNVIATSGTAFTAEDALKSQVRQIARFTKRVIVNFDPDNAGTAATEKAIGLLMEEDFDTKVVTLEGGLDPDRFVREHGIQAYGAALRGAKRYSDYLIDRAREQFPGRTAEAKVNQTNFLLPYMRRTAHPIKRAQFAEDAANKLGIDSALMREELKQAAAHRVASIATQRAPALSATERIFIRALILPEGNAVRRAAVDAVMQHPELIGQLGAGDLIEAIASAPALPNPLDAAPDEAGRVLIASVLHYVEEEKVRIELANERGEQIKTPPLEEELQKILYPLERRWLERRQRELRSQIAEADRRGDQAMLAQLITDKLDVDRRLRTH
jgi:DNA primase